MATNDARFEDAADAPLRLLAQSPEDLLVISALVQDAVLPASEIRWDRKARKLALLLNRFRWEDRAAAEARGRDYERVRSMLLIGDVRSVASQGFNQSDKDLVLSVLSLAWEPGQDGTGRMLLVLAGDGVIAAEAECLDIALKDLTRPYSAPSGKAPEHPA